MSQKEAYSRVVIDRKLREAGWDIEDSSQVVFEDHGAAGRADYVLKDESGNAIALIEAKSPDIDPYSAKQQAHDYVQAQYKSIDYIFLANDKIIYFWDLGAGDAVPVQAFYSQQDLARKRRTGRVGNVELLGKKEVEPNYFSDVDADIELRPYQIEAFNTIASQFDKGKRSFLLEMATGTGKTVLAALIISRFLRAQQAENVLFIVDRKSLASQSKATFENLLGNLSTVGTYWGSNRRNLTGANIVVATIQSLTLRGQKDFTPGYFDLVIHDEAHRSIYSPEARAAVDHFIGVTKIGLTATPKDFLKNVDVEKLAVNDPRKLERRVQRDTYKYFDCENGVATYRFTIQNAVPKYLVPPRYHKMNTVLTQSALNPEGLSLEDPEAEGSTYGIRDLERKVYIPERNRAMMEEFLRYAEKTPDGKLGKTLIFGVSQRHALDLEKILNELMPEYGGRFAKTCTSMVPEAGEIARDFKKEDNSLPRVLTTVDMLATGYDAPEVQNIVLARPIFDPTTYQQIKGRGTRLCKVINKDHFTIFDFCGVVEYFNEKYDWEAPAPTPAEKRTKNTLEPVGRLESTGGTATEELTKRPSPFTSHQADMVGIRDQIQIGPDGDVVDRNMYRDEWTKAVHKFVENHPEISDIIADPDRSEELIDMINAELLDKAKFYFNEDSLIKSHRIVAGVRDFFLSALGKEPLPTREVQLEEFKQGLVSKFGSSDKGASQRKTLMVEFFADQVIEDEELRTSLQKQPSIDFLRQESFSHAFPVKDWLDEFGKDQLEELVVNTSESKLLKV